MPAPAPAAHHILPVRVLAEPGQLDRFYDLDSLRAACATCNSRRGAQLVNAGRRGRPRTPRLLVSTEQAAEAWVVRERAYWASVERQRQAAERRRPTPRIY